MKKIGGAVVILAVICGFLLLGSNRAEAMNNESAALLAGAVVLFAPPVIQAMTGGYAYAAAVPRFAYYPARTEVVVIDRGQHRYEREREYWRGRRDQRRHDYRRSRGDEGRYHSRDRY
jgi:hypothetical protein